MKKILVLLLLISSYSYGQRSFTLADNTRRDTLIYMNDATGRFVPVIVSNLLLNQNAISQVNCGNNESIRSAFLKRGVARLISPRLGTDGDRKSQIIAYHKKIGFWSHEEFNQEFDKKVAFQKKQKSKLLVPAAPIPPQYLVRQSAKKSRIASSKLYYKNNAIQNVNAYSLINSHRIYVYRFTKNRKLFFRRKINDTLTKNTIAILVSSDMTVDYKYIDTVYCGDDLMLEKKLILMGAIGLNYPNDQKFEKVRSAFFFAQNNKLGIWKNFDRKNPSTLKPVIEIERPPTTFDPDLPPLTGWQKFKISARKLYDVTLGRLFTSTVASAVSWILNMVLVILQIKQHRGHNQ